MNYFLPTLYFLLRYSYALYTLPAPVNVSVDSHDFLHVLQWSPGPGTPPGTVYNVYRVKSGNRCDNNKRQILLANSSNSTKLERVQMNINREYRFCVQASHNNSQSKKAESKLFTPFQDTVISPPKFLVNGCGNCLLLNIQPRLVPDYAKNKTFAEFYNAFFSVFWRKAATTKQIQEQETESLNYTIKNLDPYVEYCVRVNLKININPNTAPSEWECAYTSIDESLWRVPAVLTGVSGLLIAVIVTIFVSMFGLIYTGFLCKQKPHLPRALLTGLIRDYFLTPERTIPDLVSITSEQEEQEKIVREKPKLAVVDPSLAVEEEEDEDEDEEGNKDYMVRPTGLSSDTSSGRESQDASGSSLTHPEEAEDSGGLSVEVAAEGEGEESVVGMVLADEDGREVKMYGARVSISYDADVPADLGHCSGEQQKAENVGKVETSGNVNLFSVTLGTIVTGEESEADEEEENQTNDFVISEKQPLLPKDIQRTLRVDSMGSQNQIQMGGEIPLTQHQTDRALLPDCALTYSEYDRRAESTGKHSGYLLTHTGNMQTGDESAEEEEEENCSGYIGH